MLKKILAGACAASMVFTSIPVYAQETTASQPNEEFTNYLEKEFKETLESSYTTLHSYVTNPESYNLSTDQIEVSLGNFEDTDEDRQEVKDELKELKSFDRNTLDETQQNIYDEYLFSLETSEELSKEKYQYLANIWSSTSNVAYDLSNYFANFEAYSEYDVQSFITLLKDTKRYTKAAIKHSKKQAENETLCFNYKEVMKTVNEVIKNKDNNEIYNNISNEIDDLGLDETTAQNYKDQIQTALNEVYFPSFTYLKKELKKLKDDNLSARPVTSFKNGKKYYSLLIRNQASTSKKPKKILEELYDGYSDAYDRIESSDVDTDITTSFTSADEIMSFLVENYTNNMPEITIPNYDVQSLPTEQTSDSIVAYYVVPSIDGNETNRIRYNSESVSKDANTIDTYITFAHEGIPGHMYQTNYFHANNTYNIQSLFDETAYTEGFAEFSEVQALEYLPNVTSEQARVIMENNDFLSYSVMSILDLNINLNSLSEEEFVEQFKDSYTESALKELYKDACYDPASALPYCYGYLRLSNMQENAKEKLGDAYDNKAFVTTLLNCGEVNLDILDKRMDIYINQVQA